MTTPAQRTGVLEIVRQLEAAQPSTLTAAEVEAALDCLDNFFEEHAGDADEAFDRAIAADRSLHAAAVCVLRALYGPGEHGAGLDAETWTGFAGLVLHASPDARRRFIQEALFDVAAPPLYAGLAPLIRAVFDGDGLGQALLDGLARSDVRQRINALALPYYLLGRDGDLALAPGQRAAIAESVAALAARTDVSAAERRALDTFVLPEAPIA